MSLDYISISPPQHTPLHIAVKEFQIHTMESLVANGADINSKDDHGVIIILGVRRDFHQSSSDSTHKVCDLVAANSENDKPYHEQRGHFTFIIKNSYVC